MITSTLSLVNNSMLARKLNPIRQAAQDPRCHPRSDPSVVKEGFVTTLLILGKDLRKQNLISFAEKYYMTFIINNLDLGIQRALIVPARRLDEDLRRVWCYASMGFGECATFLGG